MHSSPPPITTPSLAEGVLLAQVDDAARLHADVEAFAAIAPTLTAAHWRRVRARCAAAGPEVLRFLQAAEASDGGKHLRPRLVAAAYLAFGGADRDLLAEVAGAQQLVHLGLCMHDDVIDGDELRHGSPNLIARYRSADRAAGVADAAAQRQGLAAALLAGDLALNAALLALLTVPAAVPVRHRLVLEATRALEQTIAGELLDVRSELLPPDRAEPLRVAELKTAVYSVSLPLRLGAIAAGAASADLIAALDRAGIAFGIAYQLADDDLGLFGTRAVTGKSVLSDVRQGKRTEHIRLAYARAGQADRDTLDAVLGTPTATDRDADLVRDIVLSTGARDDVMATIDDQVARGIRFTGDLPAPLATFLTGLARSMRRRVR